MIDDTPVCTPEDDEALRADGSYPSGLTAIGWGWALILAQLMPDRADAILERGRAFGESRAVCNVHWYSDVVAGRIVGSAAVAPASGRRGVHRGNEKCRCGNRSTRIGRAVDR